MKDTFNQEKWDKLLEADFTPQYDRETGELKNSHDPETGVKLNFGPLATDIDGYGVELMKINRIMREFARMRDEAVRYGNDGVILRLVGGLEAAKKLFYSGV